MWHLPDSIEELIRFRGQTLSEIWRNWIILYFTILYYTMVMDRDQILKVLIWTKIYQDPGQRSSEVIGCTCDGLPQLAAVSPLGDYIRGVSVPLLSGCVSLVSQSHQWALCISVWVKIWAECVWRISFGQFPCILALFCTWRPDIAGKTAWLWTWRTSTKDPTWVDSTRKTHLGLV